MKKFNETILLIDNDYNFLEKVKKLLESEGYINVVIARNCKDALNLIEDIEDLYIISEFQFKSMSGEELLTKLKKRLNGKMKVIILSNSKKLSDSFKTMRLGALSFIHKTEDNWKSILNDSLTTWITYYNQKEMMRNDFVKEFN